MTELQSVDSMGCDKPEVVEISQDSDMKRNTIRKLEDLTFIVLVQ